MSPVEAISSVFRNYVNFSGRAQRSEYWWWVLFIILVSVATQIIDGAVVAPLLGFAMFEDGAGQPLSVMVSLALLIPNVAVGVRRLHDLDRSGWWLLIGLIPLVGVLVLIYWFAQRGTVGSNAHGDDPFGKVE